MLFKYQGQPLATPILALCGEARALHMDPHQNSKAVTYVSRGVFLQAKACEATRRARTAIRRYRCSKPIAIALADGLINRTTTVFDYGCGHGADVKYLCSKGVQATGWDSHHQPKAKIQPADVVNLGYVLNVIEDPSERAQTLHQVAELTKQALIVAVRADNSLEDAEKFGDGKITVAGTFQKIYDQIEFRDYLTSLLNKRPYLVAPGIAYLFSDSKRESDYLATQIFTRRLEYRTDLIEAFAKDRVARQYVKLANRLGRIPLPEEFPHYSKLTEVFGSPQRVERLTLSHVDRTSFEGSRAQRREDILTYLATLRLQAIAPPPIGHCLSIYEAT